MSWRLWGCLATLLVLSAASGFAAEVRLLGRVDWSGTARDASGLTDDLAGIPHDRLGGFSGIEYLGRDHLYAVLSDRGPRDGAVPFRCRYHVVQLELTSSDSTTWHVDAKLRATHLLTNSAGASLVGSLAAFDVETPTKSLRFDPEAIRQASNGDLLIADEYGPTIHRFQADGRAIDEVDIPRRFRVETPGATPADEAAANATGRQPNGGFESLCLTPDGSIVAMVQRPLIQDSASGPAGKRPGRNLRLVRREPNGAVAEHVYRLEDSRFGVNELLAVSHSSALAIERDSEAGSEATAKRIYWIDWSAASDVSGLDQLPSGDLPAHVASVKKRLLIDLLDPRFGMAGKRCPEKFEGLAFGPRLADGSRLLVVTVDNDFEADTDSVLLFFSVPEACLAP